MRMQEPEQSKPSGQEWQSDQEYGEYRGEYTERYEGEQQQKIYPQEERRLESRAFWIIAIILSSIGFFPAVVGIAGSAIVLKYANGQQALLAGGVMGLVSSIIVMLVCVAIFVIAVVALAIRTGRVRRRMGATV